MRDLHTYFNNPFDDANVSMAALLAFTTDHVQRMTSTSPALFAARLTATNAALTGVNNTFTDDETKLGVRKARKLAKNNFREALPKSVGKLAVAVENKYGEGAPEFAQCFPHGRASFRSCTDDKLGNELQTLINGVTALQAVLGAQAVTDATALLTGWNAVFSPSEASAGAKTTTQAAKNAARQGLQLELFKNLLTLAMLFARQPEQLDLYMQQSLLQPHTHTPATPTPPTPPTTTEP